MNLCIKRRFISCILCAAAVCTPVIAAAASDVIEAELGEDSWSFFESRLEVVTDSAGDVDYDGYIVKIKAEAECLDVRTMASEDGIEVISEEDGLYAADDLQAVEDFVYPEDIEYIEPNYIVSLFDSELKAVKTDVSGSENDAHLALMNADAARSEYGLTGDDMDTETDMGNDGNPDDQIIVAVIDSGLDPDHEDIDYSHVVEGESFVDTTTEDTMGHGTFVAGEIIAAAGNGLGVDGIADDLYVMPLKAFSSKNSSNAILIKAINYAAEQKSVFDQTCGKEGSNICVINMSLGSEAGSEAMKSAVDKAIEAGIIVICAAGNDGDSRTSYPAQYAIGVGSTNTKGVRSSYSQILSEENGEGWENKVWVTSPGESYTSLWYTGVYYTSSGTSFSSPQAAALAGLAVSLRNDLVSYYEGQKDFEGNEITRNHYAFRQMLKDTARTLDNNLEKASNGQDTYYGWGMIDFKNMADLLSDYETRKGESAQVTFTIDDGAGMLLTPEKNHLEISVKAYDEQGEISDTSETADEDGVYTLKIGTKYQYTIKADKYIEVKKDFTVLMMSRRIFISMEGYDYYTDFSIKNLEGNPIPEASVIVETESGDQVEQNPDGSFTTKNGSYTYAVSAQGYFPKYGGFTINDAEREYPEQKYNISIVLTGEQDVCSVTFDISASDGEAYPEVSVFDAEGNPIEPYSDGSWKLIPGIYSYSAESDDYSPVGGEITIAEEERGASKVISEVMTERLYWVSIETEPLSVSGAEGTSFCVTDSLGNEVEPFSSEAGKYHVVNGNYSYTVRAIGYKTETGDFTVSGEDVHINVKLEEGTDFDESGSNDDNTPSNGTSSGGENGSGGSSGSTSGGSGGSAGGSSGGGSTASAYQISIVSGSGGSASVSAEKATVGEKIIITIKPQSGYEIDTLAAVDGEGEKVSLTESEGSYTFQMPASDVAVNVSFRSVDETGSSLFPFNDVASGAWYRPAVEYVWMNGLMNGISADLFAPNSNLTRAMIVQVLYNKEGKPSDTSIENGVTFTDVSDDAWYKAAVDWASAFGIIEGYGDGTFGAEKRITREQMAAVFCRYAQYKGAETSARGDLSRFTDADEISSWASDAVAWCVENGILSGTSGGMIKPDDTATRGEAAQILMNFCSAIQLS